MKPTKASYGSVPTNELTGFRNVRWNSMNVLPSVPSAATAKPEPVFKSYMLYMLSTIYIVSSVVDDGSDPLYVLPQVTHMPWIAVPKIV